MEILPVLSLCQHSNVGHMVDSTIVSTGPGVNYPESVSKELLDGALKAVQHSMANQLDEMKRL